MPELPCSERSRGSGDAIWSWGACCGFTFTSSLNRGYRINYNPNYARLVTGTARKLVTNGFAKRALFSENLSRRSTPTYGGWCHSQNVNQRILISIVVSDHGEMKSSASQRDPNMEFFPVLAKTSFHQVFFSYANDSYPSHRQASRSSPTSPHLHEHITLHQRVPLNQGAFPLPPDSTNE